MRWPQNLRWVEERARPPHHVVRGNGYRDVVVVEAAVELPQIGEIHPVPTVVIVVYGDAGIEVRQIPRRRIDHALAVAAEGDLVVPFEGEAHCVVREQRLGRGTRG